MTDRAFTNSINDVLKGDFQSINRSPMIIQMNFLLFGRRMATKIGKINNPAKSDNLPVIKFEKYHFKIRSFRTSTINPDMKYVFSIKSFSFIDQ